MVSEALNSKYMGRNYVWVLPNDESVKEGMPVRCLGVIEVDELGGKCLNLTNGVPVPISKIDMYLKSTDFDANIPDAPVVGEFHRDESLVDNYIIKDEPKKYKKPEQVSSGTSTVSIMETPDKPIQQQVITQEKPKVDMFNGFKKTSTKFELSLNLDLPAWPLVEMMYQNSDNKDEFVLNFSRYIIDNINIESVKTSVTNLFNYDTENQESEN